MHRVDLNNLGYDIQLYTEAYLCSSCYTLVQLFQVRKYINTVYIVFLTFVFRSCHNFSSLLSIFSRLDTSILSFPPPVSSSFYIGLYPVNSRRVTGLQGTALLGLYIWEYELNWGKECENIIMLLREKQKNKVTFSTPPPPPPPLLRHVIIIP